MWFYLKRESGMSDLIGGKDMKTRSTIECLLGLAVLTFFGCNTAPGGAPAPAATPSHELLPLQLIQRIPAPGVTGRIDHFTAYPKRRLQHSAGRSPRPGCHAVPRTSSTATHSTNSGAGCNWPHRSLHRVPQASAADFCRPG